MIVIYEHFLSFKDHCLVIVPCINTWMWSSQQRALALIYSLVLQPLNPSTALWHVSLHVTWKCSFPVLAHQETHSNLSESQKKRKEKVKSLFEDLVCVTESSRVWKFFVAPGGASAWPFFCITTELKIAARNSTSRCAGAEVVSWALYRRGRRCVPVRNAVGRDERCLLHKFWHALPCLANFLLSVCWKHPELPRCSPSMELWLFCMFSRRKSSWRDFLEDWKMFWHSR